MLTYFTFYYDAEELRQIMPIVSMIVNICNDSSGVPFQFLRMIPSSQFQIGYGMYWPVGFNLVVPCNRFSRRHKLPLFD